MKHPVFDIRFTLSLTTDEEKCFNSIYRNFFIQFSFGEFYPCI
jgi:hypothetical protein